MPSTARGELPKAAPAGIACQLRAPRPRQSIPCLQALPRRGLAEGGNAGWHWPRCRTPPHVPLALPMVADAGCGSLLADGVMGPRSQRESAQAAGSLLRSHGGSTEGCGCQLLAQPPRRETEAAPAVSQTRLAGLCGNAVISLQMSDDKSCCVNNIPPEMRYIICNEAMRAATEQDMLSGREGLESGNSINSPNRRLRQGALLRGWSLRQKPGCSHTAFASPASRSDAVGLVDSELGRGKAPRAYSGVSRDLWVQAPMVLIWDPVFERYCGGPRADGCQTQFMALHV